MGGRIFIQDFCTLREKQLTGQHVHVGTVWDAENVGRDFVTSLADVHLDDTLGVDRETLVRVDSHAEETGVGLLLLFHRNQNNQLISMCPHSFFLLVVLLSIQTTTTTPNRRRKTTKNNHNTQQNKGKNDVKPKRNNSGERNKIWIRRNKFSNWAFLANNGVRQRARLWGFWIRQHSKSNTHTTETEYMKKVEGGKFTLS